MKRHTTPLLAITFTLLLGGCFVGASSSVEWTAGTWTEGEFAAGTNEDECGIVSILNGLDSPLQYKLAPKSEGGRTDTGGFYHGNDGLSDEAIASVQDNLWAGCDEPEPRFWCNFPVHDLHKEQWASTLQEQFCPDSTDMSIDHGDTEGLVLNENEIFLVHYISLECGTDAEASCNSRYVSRMHPAGGGN